jgi:uncharacterized protein (TIGR03437 family)
MLRLFVLTLAMCACANGQFFGLATTADGSRVYFATPLRQKNTVQPPHGKIFQVDSAGLQLVLSREREEPPPPPYPTTPAQTNPYDLFSASVSADGKTVAASGRRDCAYGECIYQRVEGYTTTITAGGKSRDYPGSLHLSANGEWAFGGSSFGLYSHPAYLAHVTTGEEIPLLIPSEDGRNTFDTATAGRPVADDGTAVYSTGNEVVILGRAPTRRIAVGSIRVQTRGAVMDRSGKVIVFSACDRSIPCIESIRLVDDTPGGSSLLISDGYAPSVSDDGRTMLYLSNRTGKPQPRIFTFAGGIDRALPPDTAGIASAILSGDGSTVYAVTLGGRLIRITVATRVVQEVIPRTPYPDSYNNGSFPAPGKLWMLRGVGLTDLSFTADPPLPESLNGIRVSFAGLPARIQSVTPSAVTVLVPPAVVPGGGVPMEFASVSPSPFDAPLTNVQVARSAPEFLSIPGTGILVAAHQDWSGAISEDSPAGAGEVIHAYAVGLGDTSPAVAYGEAAPAREPFARTTTPMGCSFSFVGGGPPEFLFAGLAPNLAGVYQIDLRLPSPLPEDRLGIFCVWVELAAVGLILRPRSRFDRPCHNLLLSFPRGPR